VGDEILNKNFLYTLSLVNYSKYSDLHQSPAAGAFGFILFYKNYFDVARIVHCNERESSHYWDAVCVDEKSK